jgi:SAM-dependent methyltransferase
MQTETAERRLYPRITDTDWLVLRELRSAVEGFAALTADRGKVAIDFGCGSEPYRSIFESKGTVYRGADFTDADILINDEGRVDARSASFDLVLSFQVLEHVHNVGNYLSEAHRLLHKGGWLILSTHGTWLYHPHPEDHRRWTRHGLIVEMADHGFETVKCASVLGPLSWTTLLRLTCAYHACLRLPVIGRPLANALAIALNARAYLEDMLTPEWVARDNACVYVILARPTESCA